MERNDITSALQNLYNTHLNPKIIKLVKINELEVYLHSLTQGINHFLGLMIETSLSMA